MVFFHCYTNLEYPLNQSMFSNPIATASTWLLLVGLFYWMHQSYLTDGSVGWNWSEHSMEPLDRACTRNHSENFSKTRYCATAHFMWKATTKHFTVYLCRSFCSLHVLSYEVNNYIQGNAVYPELEITFCNPVIKRYTCLLRTAFSASFWNLKEAAVWNTSHRLSDM